MSDVSIQYIGKESNDLEEVDVIGVSEDKYTEYVNNERIEDIAHLISNLDVVQAKEIGISRRHLFRLQRKIKNGIVVKLNRKTAQNLIRIKGFLHRSEPKNVRN